MATGTSVGSFRGDSMKWRLEYCFISEVFLQSCSKVPGGNSKAVSPPAAPALASDFLAPQEVTKKRCRATPPVLRPGSLRFSPGPSIAGNPAQFAGRLRGMSGFAYFFRHKSRSHQPAQPAAKPPLILLTPVRNQSGKKTKLHIQKPPA